MKGLIVKCLMMMLIFVSYSAYAQSVVTIEKYILNVGEIEVAPDQNKVEVKGVSVKEDMQEDDTLLVKTEYDDNAALVFTGDDFSRADLRRRDFGYAKLNRVDFSSSDLSYVDLSNATVTGSDFSGADLRGACLINAKITGNDFSGADLTGANLTGAKNSENNFDGAIINGIIWNGSSECPKTQKVTNKMLWNY